MHYPEAIDPSKVGEYPVLVHVGGGYFYDQVLEYRVWCHPEQGAPDHHDGSDYFFAFASLEDAQTFSEETIGAESPLVLIRQFEWIDEPGDGDLIHENGERLTEWRVEWLDDGPRQAGDIESFIQARLNA